MLLCVYSYVFGYHFLFRFLTIHDVLEQCQQIHKNGLQIFHQCFVIVKAKQTLFR